ncbi:CocE/NonD family hydrolase [Lysobacter sp. LF1]|uniref:CocE/NonD family hydrolase n=1 Tax=Lysobacter stagni TaxID=3045172 RepID=A0ABT6XEN0_9GAMM|nr:CocE/NonD family hydrolase [Lysobacter sp. LF1]MDI9238355.1 CocE/NonD family hydrolase [Lysobacter sp. LF1]
MRPALVWWIVLVALALAAGALFVLRERIPANWQQPLRALVFNVRIDDDVRIVMPDGTPLAGTLYRPRGADSPLPTIYVRLPYDRRRYGEALGEGMFFARNGYAVLVQDVRGKFESGGDDFVPWRHATADGAATLDWIAAQPWSNGKVGTIGCSALGELQYALARANHPAHAAMIPMAAGGAAGDVAGQAGYFGAFEGGVFQLASAAGWFSKHGLKASHGPWPETLDMAGTLRTLPTLDVVRRVRPGANAYEDFLQTSLGDPRWRALDYVSEDDRPRVPALVIDTWGDPSLSGTLAITEAVRRHSPDAAANQHVVIAPGNHCEHELIAGIGRFGDLPVRNADRPYREWYLAWFDYWLRGKGDGLAKLPAYQFFVLNEQRWLSSTQWPPAESRVQAWYLGSGGRANGRDGDGVLALQPARETNADEFLYDPLHPVPSRGGPLCCTGDPTQQSGPVDQRDVEVRDDVLVYTSAPLQAPLRIAGPLRAQLVVSSSAPDTDFVARLVDVSPDGRAINIQEGALRARYRDGVERPSPMTPGKRYVLDVPMRSIAYLLPAGHRLRLDITSSSFPRLERNLNTGGRNYDESAPAKALNRIFHGGDAVSFVELSVLDTPVPEERSFVGPR